MNWVPRPEALRTWVKKAEIYAGARPGTTTSDAERIRQLEKEVRELRRANGDPAQGERVYAPRAECEAPLEVIDSFIDGQQGGPWGLCRSARCLLAPASRSPLPVLPGPQVPSPIGKE